VARAAIAVAFGAALASAITACGDETCAGDEGCYGSNASQPHLFKSSAGSQMGVVNQPVAIRPTLRVLDQYHNYLPGVTVYFAVTGGGGQVSTTSTQTDSAGYASVEWTLGNVSTVNTLFASLDGHKPDNLDTVATFYATALPAAQSPQVGGPPRRWERSTR
jgi:hypothetical protein